MHVFESRNGGEIRRADWDDLNYPARMATLACAGLPMIQRANPGAVVATQLLTKRLGLGVFFDSLEQLGAILRDGATLGAVRARVRQECGLFTFEHHAPGLIDFFRAVIEYAGSPGVPATVRLPAAGLPVRAAVPPPAAQRDQPVPPPEAA